MADCPVDDEMSMSYTEIKKDLMSSETEKDSETAKTPDRPDDDTTVSSDFDTEGRPFSKPKASPEKKEKKTKIKPRKDIICEDCGGTYSSKTKAHKCRPPQGFVKDTRDDPDPESKTTLPPPSPPPAPAQAEREITMEDVRGYLVRAKAAKAEHRRNTWISSLF